MCAQQCFEEIPSVPCHSRRRFGSPPTTRGGEDHRTPVGPRTRWASSRCYTRRIGWDSPNHPGSGKWTSTSPAPTCCVIGLALLTSNLTAFTVGCGLVRQSVSSPGTTGNVFEHRVALVSHARSDSAATTIRCFPREPTFGSRATMGCGGLEKSARVRRKMESTWSDVWTTRGRSSSLFPRRATRPQRGAYEVLGACRSTKPARSLGGSNVM